MAFSGGYIFKHFEGAAEPVLRDFPAPETPVGAAIPPVKGHPRAPWRMERPELTGLFRSSGCHLLYGSRFDDPDRFDTVRFCIINAVHNGPLDQAWTPKMFGDPDLAAFSVRTLKTLLPQAEITVAVNRRNRRSINSLDICSLAAVRVMSDRYPQEFPELLTRDIAGRQAGPDSVLVIPFEDALLTGECLTRGKHITGRIIPVYGPGVSRPGWRRIPAGTSFGEIRAGLLKSEEHGPWRVIRGNIFTGKTVDSDEEAVSWEDREITVIREHAERDFYRFLNPGFDYDSYSRVTVSNYIPLLRRRLDSNVHGGKRPCVQCNFCDEACPVGIYPHIIWKHVSAGMLDESLRFRPETCIGCGLCDYVCPSKIDVSAAVRKAGSFAREGRSS